MIRAKGYFDDKNDNEKHNMSFPELAVKYIRHHDEPKEFPKNRKIKEKYVASIHFDQDEDIPIFRVTEFLVSNLRA